jgi:hypothetical protein
MSKQVCILLLGILAATSVAADDGLALMRVDQGARPTGMGTAFISIGGHVYSAEYNPAGASGISKFYASFEHTSYWEDVKLESGRFAAPLSDKFVFHGGIRYAGVDNLEGRLGPTSEGEPFDAHDISFKGGLSYQINEKISAGAAMGWFIEKLESWRGSAFNIDLGLLAQVTPSLSAGASALNLGSNFELTKTGFPPSREISLPTTYRAGLSYVYDRYTGAADLVYINDKARFHVGAEGRLHELFTVRAGYMAGYDSKDFTAGISFVQRNITVDYAFVPYSNELGDSHLFGLTFSL